MKRLLVVAALILIAPVAASAAWWGMDGWQYSLGGAMVPFSSPAFETAAVTYEDDWGHDYTLRAKQEAMNTGLGLDLGWRTPVWEEVTLPGVKARGEVGITWVPATPAEDGELGSSHLILVRFGPAAEFRRGNLSFDISAGLVWGYLQFAADTMPAHHAGDPGFGFGADWVQPGAPILAIDSAVGSQLSAGIALPEADGWIPSIHLDLRSGLEFDDFDYKAKGEFGGRLSFDLPQLQPINANGLAIRAEMRRSL